MTRIRSTRVVANVTSGHYLYVDSNNIVAAPLTTSNVTEVTNLYFTNARSYSNVTQLGYITSSSLSGYATNSQLTSYATVANLNLKANTTQLAVYATNAQLASYATNAQLASYATNAQLALYATNSQLSSYATVANLNLKANTTQLAVYATNAQLASYATNAQLASYATNSQLALYATNAQLSSYATNAQLALYATNSQLSSYALTASLTTANVTELTNLYFTNARSYSNTLTALSGGGGVSYSTSNGKISLSASGVTPATYGGLEFYIPSLAVDGFGRVTSGANIIAPYSLVNASDVSGGVNLRQRIVLNGGAGGYYAGESNIKIASGTGITAARVNDTELTISANLAYSRITSNTTAVNNGYYLVDTETGANLQITLPASPFTGSSVRIADANNWSNVSCIVNRNGSTIEGQADNFALNIGGIVVDFVYDGVTWEVYASVGGSSGGGGGGGSLTITDETSSSSTYYPIFTTTTSGTATSGSVSSTKLYFIPSTGTINATEFNSLSDIAFKENIIPIKYGTEIIDSIDPVKFTWKDSGKASYGVIANVIENILPDLVTTNPETGIKSVSYQQLVPILIQAVKELSEEVRLLKESRHGITK